MSSRSNQINAAFISFRRDVYPDEKNSIMCAIHDEFHRPEDLKHNCLGCNLAESTGWIHNSLLSAVSDYEHVQEFFVNYVLKLYLFVERVHIIFDLVQLPVAYRKRHFDVFQRVRKWANFIKHPKSFLLVHHPQYFIEDDDEGPFLRSNFAVVVDQSFVDRFYSGDDRNAELFRTLANKKDIAVVFPNIEELTDDFIAAIHRVLALIKDNAVYRETLDSSSTYENYFAPQTTAAPEPPAPQ